VSSSVLEAFRDEAVALDAVLAGLDEDDFARPTTCPPWNVKELVVHVADVLPRAGVLRDASASLVGTAPPALDLSEPADYYRQPGRGTPANRRDIVEKAQVSAAEVADGRSAARLLHETWQSAFAEWSTTDLARLVRLPVGVMRLGDYAVTRLISHAAHGLDLALSLGLDPWTTPSALAVMRPVYVSLLGGEPPAGWGDQDFFARATGRIPLTAAERAALDGRADRFPLLS
jgi:uncharacterized protein (TIGR03083 family)